MNDYEQIRSRVPSKEYKDNYDKIFRKDKKEEEVEKKEKENDSTSGR